MRLAITIGRVDDQWSVIAQPSIDVQAHKELFRAIAAAEGAHGKTGYHEVLTFSTDGAVEKRRVFDSDAQKQAHARRVKEDTRKFEAAQRERANKNAGKPDAQKKE